MLFLSAAALGADVADNSRIAAYRVTVDGVVDRAVAYSAFLHAADNLLEGVKVLQRVAVQLNIADMSRIGKGMVGSLQLYLGKCVYLIVNRDMEGVGVILSVGNSLYLAETLLILSDKGSRKSLGGGGKQGKVQS